MQETREQIVAKLREGGHRVTRARLAIIDIMASDVRPLTAAEIFRTLQRHGSECHRATVYRELNFLTANGIIRQVRFTGAATHYELDLTHHHHLVCTGCKSVTEVTLGTHLESHERQILEQEQFKVVSHSLEFYGLCRDCNEGRS